MPIPSSGPVSLLDIQTEFGGTNPIGLNEYYAGGGLVPAGTSGTNGPVPSSGAISIFNFYGTSNVPPFGAVEYTTAGTYTFVVPASYTSISAVCVGGGAGATGNNGGGGGALSYSNGISVTPGESLTVVVGAGGAVGAAGADSRISRGATNLLLAKGGAVITAGQASAGVGAVRYSGGNGSISAGGGAAGYAGNGGAAATGTGLTSGSPGTGGSAGGGGRGNNTDGGGGGVGLIVQGPSGAGGVGGGNFGGNGGGGSGGTSGGIISSRHGGTHGGGGGANWDITPSVGAPGGVGGVRIIYGGTGKTYPNNSAP